MRVGIIGAGGIGTVHANCYKNIPDAKVVAVADIIPERSKKLADIFEADPYDNAEDVIKRKDIDVIDVCVPTYLHSEFVIKAASAKKHVLCEKPMALTYEDGLKMIETASKNDVKFMIAHVLRFFPEYIKAREIINSGSIGLPKVVRTYRGGPNPAIVREWYGYHDKSGGSIQDSLIHDIDFLTWTFGPVREVYTRGNVFRRKEPFDPEYDLVMMEFENGIIAHLVSDWSGNQRTQFGAKIEIAGTDGLVEFSSFNSIPLKLNLFEENKGKAESVSIPESPLSPGIEPYTREIREFLESVEKDSQIPVPAHDALYALKVALTCIESMRVNKPLEVKL
ncbi:Gfo/Idh/MocA family protein [Athalassotoga sp.]|uniref:Gfo/Idh/MocA family protein n=1 Tax=Athalassotoga sp. TaxID=2022597 RepID=UPI003CFD443E